ncbi:MAG: PAS domain S-box protein [Prochlorotrichaceae cyanobacterium]
MITTNAAMSLKEPVFQRFFRSTPDLMVILDWEGRIHEVNPAVEKLTGWTAEQLRGNRFQDYLPLQESVLFQHYLEQGRQQQATTLKTKLCLLNRDRQVCWVSWSLVLDFQEGQVYGVGRDITQQKETEAALFRSNTRLQAVINNAPVIVYALDKDGYFLFSEGRGLERLGLSPGENVGRSVFEEYKAYPETIAAIREGLDGRPQHWVERVKDCVYDCRIALVENDRGKVQGLIGVATDITELIEAQETLENLFLGTASVTGQDFFNALVQYLATALGVEYAMISDLRGDRFYTLAFWANGEIQPNIDYAVTSAPGCSKVLNTQECLYVPQMGEERNCQLLKPLGVNTYLGTPLKNAQGEVVGTLCILNDRPLRNGEQAQRILKIFAARAGAELNRLKVEQALEHLNQALEARVKEQTQRWQQSQLEFKRLIQNVPGAVYTVSLSSDAQMRVLYMSDNITDLLGLNPKSIETNAQVLVARIHPEDQKKFEQSKEKVLKTKKPWLWDGRFLHQDGTYRWLRWSAQRVDVGEETLEKNSGEEASNQPLNWDGVLIDISDRKSAEINMKFALQKQREINEIRSRLITTMSHEFRTPLSVISSSASILKSFADKLSDDKKKQHLETIETYIQHTSQLLEDILVLNRVNAGQLSFQPKRVDIINLLSQLINDMHISHGEHPLQFQILPHNLSQGQEGDLDSKLLRQIVLNLISNAVKYSKDKTPVEVILLLTIDEIFLTVKDFGIGILPEDKQQLFEPFHRGQNVGERSGTGLGLSVVKGCLDLHQGQISVQSQPGKGTVFTVTLPRYAAGLLTES